MDAPRQRQLLLAALAALVVLLGLFAAGLWFGGHPDDLPGFLRSAFVADHETLVVNEAIDRIAHSYYRPVSKAQLSNSSIAGAVAGLGDQFSHYLTPHEYHEFDEPGSFTGIGVEADPDPRGLRISRVFNSSPAARAGLHSGEVIIAVNGRALRGIPAETARNLIRGTPGTDALLALEGQLRGTRSRAAGTRTVRVTRATISEPVVASLTRTVHGVKLGVVALTMFSADAAGEVREAVNRVLHEGARGVVLDLRGNGGGLVVEAQHVASVFIPSGVIVTLRSRTQPRQTFLATGGAISPRIPLVVLVDGNTASSAEIVTGAMQDHGRATVVGTHTYGKGVFQDETPLANGGALDITVGEFFTPNGRNLGGGGVKRGAGITPEVRVPRGVDSEHGLEVALSTLAAKVK